MIINEIFIKSYLSAREKTISGFKNGLNVICGLNEAGKSTLMEFIRNSFFSQKGKKDKIEGRIKFEYKNNFLQAEIDADKVNYINDLGQNVSDFSINEFYFKKGFTINLDELIQKPKNEAELINAIVEHGTSCVKNKENELNKIVGSEFTTRGLNVNGTLKKMFDKISFLNSKIADLEGIEEDYRKNNTDIQNILIEIDEIKKQVKSADINKNLILKFLKIVQNKEMIISKKEEIIRYEALFNRQLFKSENNFVLLNSKIEKAKMSDLKKILIILIAVIAFVFGVFLYKTSFILTIFSFLFSIILLSYFYFFMPYVLKKSYKKFLDCADLPNSTLISEISQKIEENKGYIFKIDFLKKDILALEEENKNITEEIGSIDQAENLKKLNKNELQNLLNAEKSNVLNQNLEEKNRILGTLEQKAKTLSAVDNLSSLINEKSAYADKCKNTIKNLLKIRTILGIFDLVKEDFNKSQVNVSLANKYFEILTNGKYKRILVENGAKPALSVEGEVDCGIKDFEQLSRATKEQVYFALKLGYASNFKEDNLPLILDDIFVNFDSDRLEMALECLNEFAKNHQILFFTCHENTICDLLKQKEIKFEKIKLFA